MTRQKHIILKNSRILVRKNGWVAEWYSMKHLMNWIKIGKFTTLKMDIPIHKTKRQAQETCYNVKKIVITIQECP